VLSWFFGEEKTVALMSQIFGHDSKINSEHVFNYLTLSVQVQQWWDRAICAFRPISINDEKTEIEIAFHWLPLRDAQNRRAKVPILAHPDPDQLQQWIEGPSDDIRLWHVETGQLIRSGFIFKITTTDPENQPLPSFELLSLRWNLSRVAAMQGDIDEEEEEEEE
jgi:hypothetical protein